MISSKKRLTACSKNKLYLSGTGDESESPAQLLFENLEWLTTEEAAVYLRKVSTDGTPLVNTIQQMVCRGLIKKRKFGGRLYFKRRELAYLIETFSGAKP